MSVMDLSTNALHTVVMRYDCDVRVVSMCVTGGGGDGGGRL